MTVIILTPEWSRTVENVEAVFLPGVLGPFEVLRGHAPIISTLSAAKVTWRVGSEEESVDIKGGAASVRDDVVKICAEI